MWIESTVITDPCANFLLEYFLIEPVYCSTFYLWMLWINKRTHLQETKKKKWFLSQKFTVDSQGKMYQNLQLASWPQIKFLRMAHTKRILLTCFFLAYTRSSANGWNAKLSVVVKGPAAINYKKEISNK